MWPLSARHGGRRDDLQTASQLPPSPGTALHQALQVSLTTLTGRKAQLSHLQERRGLCRPEPVPVCPGLERKELQEASLQ